MSCREVSKYPESSSRTSSASRDSESDVNPTRSANSTETSRRSDSWGAAGVGTGEGAPSESAVPHSPQNLALGAFAVPQLGQARTRRLPHSAQNFRPASFSVPQAEQTKDPP